MMIFISKPSIQTMNQIVVDNIPYQKKDECKWQQNIASQKEIQMMRKKKRKSNTILMSGVKNKWIFIRMDQKNSLVKKIAL